MFFKSAHIQVHLANILVREFAPLQVNQHEAFENIIVKNIDGPPAKWSEFDRINRAWLRVSYSFMQFAITALRYYWNSASNQAWTFEKVWVPVCMYFCRRYLFQKPMPFTLYMLMIGCRPPGRFTEQHDVFFGIAETPAGLIPKLNQFWAEARGRMHVDALRPVTAVDGYAISVQPRSEALINASHKLFFLNLGGYKQDVFDEAHYKMLVVAANKSDAIKQAKQTAFYKHTGIPGAPSHIDDKWGVDVDDVYEIDDILPAADRALFAICIAPATTGTADPLELGYITFDKLAGHQL